MTNTFKAHFDGTQIVADETVDLPSGARLLVTVLDSPDEDAWRQKWQEALARDSSEEPEFRLDDEESEGQVRVWRLITHHEDRDAALRWSLTQGRMAIGWGRIGDLANFEDEAAMREAILHQFKIGNHPLDNSKMGGFSAWNFGQMMQIGDLVILRGAKSSRVVEVVGGYFFEAKNTPLPNDFYNHQRQIRVTSIDADKLWQRAGKMAPDGGSIYRTLIRCQRRVTRAGL